MDRILILFVFLASACTVCLGQASYSLDFQEIEDPCYDKFKIGKFCEPEFANAAFQQPVSVSTQCGAPTTPYDERTFCRKNFDEREKFRRAISLPNSDDTLVDEDSSEDLDYGGKKSADGDNSKCMLCNGENAKAEFLTDMEALSGETCWVSGRVKPERNDTVTLQLDLHKAFEVSYVTLKFCHENPDEIVVSKSNDFGRSWTPFHYFAKDCRAAFGMQPDAKVLEGNEDVPLCTQTYSALTNELMSSRVAFTTLDSRPSETVFHSSPQLQEWVTATNIRVELRKLPASARAPDAPVTGHHFAVSDFAVGGRCKCNGHASKCFRDPSSGRLECACQHGTGGQDCEECQPFYVDTPWRRASRSQAHECKQCQCHSHATQCKFDKQLYEMSGRVSGGVCENCEDNTAGRSCQYCTETHFRNFAMPMNHRDACSACDCHPVGSIGTSCNQTSGQCQCKDGVVGLKCNSCAESYTQTQSHVQPCVKKPSFETGPLARQGASSDRIDSNGPIQCPSTNCKREARRLNPKKWCLADIVMNGYVVDATRVGNWWRYAFKPTEIFKEKERSRRAQRNAPSSSINRLPADVRKIKTRFVWVPVENVACKCPKLKPGKQYLLVGTHGNEENAFVVSPSKNGKGAALKWRLDKAVDWTRRLKKFERRESRGRCDKIGKKREAARSRAYRWTSQNRVQVVQG